MTNLNISEIRSLVPADKLLQNSNTTGAEQAILSVEQLVDRAKSGLQAPLDFPTLDLAIIPDDQVCVVVEPGTPCAFELVETVLQHLVQIGIQLPNVTILFGEGHRDSHLETFSQKLTETGLGGAKCEVHQPHDRESMGFLATSQSGDPIQLSSALVHSDFVIPIGFSKRDGWKSGLSFLFPYFSDHESQGRFFKLSAALRRAFSREVIHWLGTMFAIEVVCRDENNLLDVLVGNQKKVEERGTELLQRISQEEAADSLSDLVIAEVGTHAYCSFEEVLEILSRVRDFASEQGTCVVLWNDEREQTKLIKSPNVDLDEFQSSDQMLFIATNQTAIQKMGWSTITNVSEVARLIEKHKNCKILVGLHTYC